MAYAGIQMFMEKLKHIINNTNHNNIPSINNPEIVHQFQLLYDELDSMIQILFFNNQHQYLEKEVVDLKKRFIYAAEEAEYKVDLFLTGVHKGDFPTCLTLDDVSRSLKSVKVEFMNMNMDSSPRRPQTTALNQYAAAAAQSSISRRSKKLMDEIFEAGIDGDAELIRDKLVEDQKKLDVVSIVGMGGIGKTTLATKVFNDAYVKHHFHVRVWVTVSQTYDKRAVLTQILESIRAQLDLQKANDSRLHELVYKNLMGKRYLIVIDDIWQIETWDSLKLFFSHNDNGSRILLTSRLTEVAKHANSDGLIHHLGCLNKERSWELLCQKVFKGDKYPDWSIKPGMQIVDKCQGLPLALVIIAGVLAKYAWSKQFWDEIADRTHSYIVGDENGCLETLALSYDHLPLHLRECFLYLGGFPEDNEYQVKRLTWLWVAEGFIQQDGNRSLDDIAESYLMELIDRNLVIIAHRSKTTGAVKACKIHDLVRELCLRKAEVEQFILRTERLTMSAQFSDIVITQPYKSVRMFRNKGINILDFPYSLTQNLRSIVWFSDSRSLSDVITNGYSFVLLRVLDLQTCELNDFPCSMELLVHLRYLAIWTSTGFPSSVCNLWGLQTLIHRTKQDKIDLPINISNLVNLRHLWSFSFYDNRKIFFFLPSIEKPMKLQTISGVLLGDSVGNFQKCFPYIKELKCFAYSGEQNDFKSLTYLEKLKLIGFGDNHFTFPRTLKALTLCDCCLPWSDMSIIQSLPNLQVLKLHQRAFKGRCWNTDEQEFPQLKFLGLKELEIQVWEACSTSFPCLRQLEISDCKDLEEIPLEIGDIPTLELIQIKYCNDSVDESVRRIKEEQHDLGNFDLKINTGYVRYIGWPSWKGLSYRFTVPFCG